MTFVLSAGPGVRTAIAAQHNPALLRLASLPCQIAYGLLACLTSRRTRPTWDTWDSPDDALLAGPSYGLGTGLNDLQREQHERPRRDGFSRSVGVMRPARAYHDPGARLRGLRTALEMSKDKACGILVERLSGINVSMALGVLIAACSDVAVVWGGSVLAGGALGGVVGAFGGGVGALPGAALGAGLGAQAGIWILGFLGLKSLIEDLGSAVPEVLRLYEQGFRTAWGTSGDWGVFDRHDSFRTHDAAREFAQGHVLLIVTMLSALLAYLSRGRADPAAKARILQETRESPRLGPKVCIRRCVWLAGPEHLPTPLLRSTMDESGNGVSLGQLIAIGRVALEFLAHPVCMAHVMPVDGSSSLRCPWFHSSQRIEGNVMFKTGVMRTLFMPTVMSCLIGLSAPALADSPQAPGISRPQQTNASVSCLGIASTCTTGRIYVPRGTRLRLRCAPDRGTFNPRQGRCRLFPSAGGVRPPWFDQVFNRVEMVQRSGLYGLRVTVPEPWVHVNATLSTIR